MAQSIITFLIANIATSYLGCLLFTNSLFFTGYTTKRGYVLYDKKWKTFLMFFIGFCIIFGVMALFSYKGVN